MMYYAISLLCSLTALPTGNASVADVTKELMVIEPTKESPRNSEGDLIVLKDGSLCFVYTRFSGGSGDHAGADIVCRTSADSGNAWTADRVLVPNEGQMNVMSVSLLRVANGDILLFYLRKNSERDCNSYVRRSSDELKTLSDPVRVTLTDGYHVVNNSRVVQLSTGRIVVPAALHSFVNGKITSTALPRVFFSDDEGHTWQGDKTDVQVPVPADVALQEPGVIELKDGRLFMWIRTNKGTQWQKFSEDKGLHWDEPKPGPLASPLSPASIIRDPSTGYLLCVWNDHSGAHPFVEGKRTPLCIAVSKDEGRTWGKSRVIETHSEGWYCYTSMTFVGDSLIISYCASISKNWALERLKVLRLERGFWAGAE